MKLKLDENLFELDPQRNAHDAWAQTRIDTVASRSQMNFKYLMKREMGSLKMLRGLMIRENIAST